MFMGRGNFPSPPPYNQRLVGKLPESVRADCVAVHRGGNFWGALLRHIERMPGGKLWSVMHWCLCARWKAWFQLRFIVWWPEKARLDSAYAAEAARRLKARTIERRWTAIS
jgi:hypothetical protein